MKIGIRNGSLRMEWLPAIEAAAQLGYDSVELDIRPDYAQTAMWSEQGRNALRAAAEDCGCEIASVCLGALWAISPANRDAAIRAQAREAIRDTASVAAALGARWILLPVTPGGDEVEHEECAERWIEEISAVAPAAEDAGVCYCLENVGRGCGKSAGDLLRLVTAIDSPAVGVYYDIGNAVAFGNDPAEEIRALRDCTRIVHVKDNSDYLGGGDVPVGQAVDALVEMGYDEYLVMETSPTQNPMQAGAYNLGFLRGVLAGG